MSQSICDNKTRALLDSLLVFYDDGLSQTHRMVEGGSPRSLLLQLPNQGTWSWLPNIVSRQLLNLAKDGDSTVFLGSLCQCLVTLTVKQDFLVLRRNLSCTVCPLSLVLSLGTPGKSLALSCWVFVELLRRSP